MQTCLPETTKILQILFVMWKSSRMCRRHPTIPASVTYQVNGRHLMLTCVVFFAHLIGIDITIYLGNSRSWLWLVGSHVTRSVEEVQ